MRNCTYAPKAPAWAKAKPSQAWLLALGPNLLFPCAYAMKPMLFRYDETDLLTSTISSTLRHWLHFPADEASLAQLTLVDIITSKSPTSILFLDKIWEMYKTPFSTVFNKNWHVLRSKRKLSTTLASFEKEFAMHPFTITGSLSYHKLQYLSQLISQWMENIGGNTKAADMVS